MTVTDAIAARAAAKDRYALAIEYSRTDVVIRYRVEYRTACDRVCEERARVVAEQKQYDRDVADMRATAERARKAEAAEMASIHEEALREDADHGRALAERIRQWEEQEEGRMACSIDDGTFEW